MNAQTLAVRLLVWVRKTCGLGMIVAGSAVPAVARGTAPEIDPGSAASALAMLAGGALLITDRFWRK